MPITLPLTRYRAPGDPILLGPGSDITAATFVAQTRHLAESLPERRFVINLCETRHGFMLGFAAALLRRQTSLFPSGRARSDWEQLLPQYPGAYLLSERSLQAARSFDLAPFLTLRVAGSMQMPEIASEHRAAILFTSGSTGQPSARSKTWGQLCHGAAHLAAALNWAQHPTCALVGSVSPQHMFGFEATVMLPWYAGIPVHAQTPLLPADLEIALRQCARPCWWMTTPMHLRAALKSRAALAGLEGILASTMSLPATLAAAAEAAWNVPVIEIYGSTETGALAMRRTASDSLWAPLTGVSLRHEGEGEARSTWASGSHVGPPVQLGDAIDLQPNGHFSWLGRSTDLVKVGGRRASLSALNRSLMDIPGIEDGVYVVPGEANGAASPDPSPPAPRLAAVYVSATLSPRDVLDALRTRIDSAFLPRPLYRVVALPRNAMGKLPQAALLELLAQCKSAMNRADRPQPDGAIEPMIVPAGHPALPGHFPTCPIVPGVVILARVRHAIRTQLPEIELGALLDARFHAPLLPDQAFFVRPQLQAETTHFEVRLAEAAQGGPGALIASGHWACQPQGFAATVPA